MSQEDKEIGWRFPLNVEGGEKDGFNDSGIAYFVGEPISSLAREVIQNSLDAKVRPDVPVNITFEYIDLRYDDIGGTELDDAVDSCIQCLQHEEATKGDKKTLSALKDAQQCISERSIKSLRITDEHTTGLVERHWHALLKMRGVSYKDENLGAGGSHGIGKNAPFTISRLRTVFYWTSYLKDGSVHEKLQGKSVLMSHKRDSKDTRGTGYYGVKDGCEEIEEGIPTSFRILDEDGTPVQGTSITILGVKGLREWDRDVARRTVINYFLAIERNHLALTMKLPNKEYLLDRDGLYKYFSDNQEDSEINRYRILWELSKEQPTAEQIFDDLGKCRLWVRTGSDCPSPSMVAIARKTGMIVTTSLENLRQFPLYRAFIALFVFEDDKGNELMRQMENPKHDDFEPNRLEDEALGKKVLEEIKVWIREEIRKVAGPPESGSKIQLNETARYLPLKINQGSGAEGENEEGIGDRVKVNLRPIKRPSESRKGGKPRGKKKFSGHSQESIDEIIIYNVRIIQNDNNEYSLNFSHDGGDGTATMSLMEAGEAGNASRNDIMVVTGSKKSLLHQTPVLLTSGNRTKLKISSALQISNSAWVLKCTKFKRDD